MRTWCKTRFLEKLGWRNSLIAKNSLMAKLLQQQLTINQPRGEIDSFPKVVSSFRGSVVAIGGRFCSLLHAKNPL